MLATFSGNGLWQLIKQSDATSIAILLILLGISLICWTLFIYKLFSMRETRAQLHRLLKAIYAADHRDKITSLAYQQANTLGGMLCGRVNDIVCYIGNDYLLSERSWILLQQHIVQAAELCAAEEANYNAIFSTSAAVAPLLGLLGTVWGLVHSFVNIAATQSADIAAVAPGIAEALITTIAGLLVAIPALMMFNYVQQVSVSIQDRLYEVADAIIILLHRSSVKKG